MSLSYERRSILWKIESTYGDDAAPTAADALKVSGLSIMPLEGEYRSRELMTGQQGVQSEHLFNVHAGVDFAIEAGGGGAAGTAPVWGKILRAAGYAETVTPATSVAYTLVSSGYESATIKAHVGGTDGHLQTIAGTRAAVTFEASANDLPRFRVRARGQFAAPAKVAPQSTDFSAHRLPPNVEPENVPVFTLGGQTLRLVQLSIEDGRPLRVNRYANYRDVSMGNRAITGQVTVSMPALDAKDLIAEAKAGMLQAMALTIGTQPGNILALAAPAVQAKYSGEQDNDGDLDVQLALNFTPAQGDDEATFTVT